MCGITGIAYIGSAQSPTEECIRRMCNVILHRGPDEEGLGVEDGVGLGMRRLAIIDLSGGSQPIYNEDHTVRIVFNGEIYNFRDLRKNLEQHGHRFSTNSDTESIVHAYEQYGLDGINYLNGMFAFALHDMKNKRLILARDHLGIKPLYYAITGDAVVWGSEIKAVLASGLVTLSLDVDALHEFLTWEYVPGAGTLFREIRKLEAGHLLVVDLTGRRAPQVKCFWDVPEPHSEALTDAGWLERLDAVISESVERQLVSDVPLGAFLSGGVDSSLVVSKMPNARTFSIGFDDPSYNELPFSEEVARHLGVSHTTQVIEPRVVDYFEHLMHFMDDPIGDFSIFPTYLVSRLAREHVTVALSGDGGDELFGGYETYVASWMAGRYGMVPGVLRKHVVEPTLRRLKPQPQKKGLLNKAKRFAEGMAFPEELGHARWRAFMNEADSAALFDPGVMSATSRPPWQHILDLAARAGNRDPVSKSLYIDTKSYLVDNCLVKTDRMSMAVSLEVRVPLLDKEVTELAFMIPDQLKVAKRKTKVLLKRLAAKHVPEHCVYRPKEGFSIPIKSWLATQFRPVLETYLDPRRIKDGGLFQVDTVERLKREHLSGAQNHSHVLWSLIVFEKWRSEWLEGGAHG
jgi:asparagine synthase (glutamine-hydrolysing)